MPRIVTLTTDFGTGSEYVAQMKGVLLGAAEAPLLIDISHDVPAHDVRAAAWLVGRTARAFPAGAVHLVVVDPGVGTARRLLWARIAGHEFLCPDNGVLSRVLDGHVPADLRTIVPSTTATATFHGRDVLAPAAVRLLDGSPPESLGPQLDDHAGLVRLPWPRPQRRAAGVAGEVVHIDRFGNLITNLPADDWPLVLAAGCVRVGGQDVDRIERTYGSAPVGTPIVLLGSQGLVEVAVVEGRADERLTAGIGTSVTVG